MFALRNKLKYFLSSFRGRLLFLVTVGIFGLSLTASLTSAWVTSQRARSEMIVQGLQMTESLAEQCILALLYGSPENAEKPLQAVLSFPNVDRVGIFDANGNPLVALGEKLPVGFFPERLRGLEHASLWLESEDAWFFCAPAVTAQAPPAEAWHDTTFQLETANREILGSVFVGMNKGSLKSLRTHIFFSTIGIGLSFALILFLLLNLAIKRLTRPISQLSRVMREAEQEGAHVYAEIEGPREISRMAHVFNQMMASLEERDRELRDHQSMLQTEVAIRTQELVLARDAALSASRHKSEFLANMSHELRTPLQAIIGYTDVVKEELEGEGMDENVEALDRVINNGQRLLTLINSILDLAKIEAGGMELRLQAVKIHDLVKEAAETVGPILRENRNALVVDVDADLPVQIDRDKLLQALLNLLSNAGKFTKDGTVRLTAKCEPKMMTLQVADSGIGLNEDQQRIIFDAFRQVDGSATRKFEGTGLGLAITKRFCELMGGTIAVESRPGFGSIFTIRIPLPVIPTVVEEPAISPPSAPQRVIEITLPPLADLQREPRVLLIDDDADFVDLHIKALQKAGYLVYSARTGEEAIQLAVETNPDVITLDIMMPEMDGWSVLRQIKDDARLCQIPVIIVSVVDDRTQGFGLGADDYLVKPIERAKLLTALEKVFQATKENRRKHA